VLHGPMRIAAQELGRASFDGPVDRRVHLAQREPATQVVLRPGPDALLPVDDAGDALHVEGEEDLHRGGTLSRRPRRESSSAAPPPPPGNDAPLRWTATCAGSSGMWAPVRHLRTAWEGRGGPGNRG